jgi:hypothetical protein
MQEHKRYTLAWKEQGTKRTVISPFVRSKGAAIHWLLQLKPYLVTNLSEIRAKAWQRTDKQ